MRQHAITSFNESLADALQGIDAGAGGRTDYSKYQDDPVGFIQNVLGDELTVDAKRLAKAFLKHEVVLARSGNAVGKTHLAARLALWAYKAYDNVKIFCAAAPPEDNLRNLLWAELTGCIDRNPAIFGDDKERDLHVYRDKENFITGVRIPNSASEKEREERFRGKHAPVLIFVLDEAGAIPREVYRGIESCMSGGTMVRLLCLFNPSQPIGPVYEMERARQGVIIELSALSHVNVMTGKNVIPGAVTRDATVRRINRWTRPVISGEEDDERDVFTVPDFLVGETAYRRDGTLFEPLPAGKRKITDNQFYYMILAQYPPTADERLIQDEWIDKARERWDGYVALYGETPPGIQPIMGQDVAEGGGDFNVAYLRYGGFVSRPKRWKGLDPLQSGEYGAMHAKRNGASIVYVDGTGLGAGIAPIIKRANVRAVSVKVSSSPTIKTERGEFFQMRDQLYWSLREWLRGDPQAMLPPEERLLEELRVPTFGPTKQGKIYVTEKKEMRSALGRSPDDMEALALTFHPQPRRGRAIHSHIVQRRAFANSYYGA